MTSQSKDFNKPKAVFNVSGLNRQFSVHMNRQMVAKLIEFVDDAETYVEPEIRGLTYTIHINQELAEKLVELIANQRTFVEKEVMALRSTGRKP